jgi:hypothetical protein
MQGVQRFLAGHKNAIRTATRTGPVRDITNAVMQKPIARVGSSSASVAGTFTGAEEATYDIEILDTVSTGALTAPVFSGVGNGTLGSIVAAGLSERTIDVQLTDLGTVSLSAAADVQGIKTIVKATGTGGNAFKLRVTRSGLTFTQQNFSLLASLKEGDAARIGPEFDWDTRSINSDGTIPADAHRIAFGDDTNNIYIQYKKIVDGQFSYVFEPKIAQDYAQGSVVKFVTGVYTVQLYEVVVGVDTLRETYNNIVTLYDLLTAIKSTSTRLAVLGPVAFDRTSGGQALLELSINTDARAVKNTGTGSEFATGFANITISPTAATELIEATCLAATPKDSANAGLGHELWEVRGSVTGLIATGVKSGARINRPEFDITIPQKVPPTTNSSIQQGTFGVKDISYDLNNRTGSESLGFTPPRPPICLDSPTLGVNAVDKLITLVYRSRPVSQPDCDCTADNTTALSPVCLGILNPTTGGSMPYAAGTVTRLVALYDWFADTVRSNSDYFTDRVLQDPFVSQPTNNPNIPPNFAYVSLFKMIEQFEGVLADLDKLPAGAYRTAGESAWDTAVTEFQSDVDTHLSGVSVGPNLEKETFLSFQALADGDAVSLIETAPGVFKIRKAIPGDVKTGFVKAAYLAGVNADIYYLGENDSISSTETVLTPGTQNFWHWQPSIAFPGKWVKTGQTSTTGDPAFIQEFSMNYVSATNGYLPFGDTPDSNVQGLALLSDRYTSRLKWVLISGGLSPLGKQSASDNVSGDGCWQDTGAPFWFEVTSDDGDTYAPAFPNVPYYSAKKYPGGTVVNGVTTASTAYFSTKEFGFILDIPCSGNLVPGDTITLRIGNAGVDTAYVKGDKLQLSIVAAQDVHFFGGVTGNHTQTWFVHDSVAGPRANYALDTNAPNLYNDGVIQFRITPGRLQFARGDIFSFSIEGGHFRWRKTVAGVVGAWSGSTAIVLTPILLDSGLSVTFTPGTSPAFFTGDLYQFIALQPYALSHVIKPDFDMWQWAPDDPAVAVFDLGAPHTDITAFGIAFHSLPSGATVVIEGSADNVTWLWAETITWQKDVMGKLLDEAQTARYIRLTIEDAPNAGIGWFYVGPALAFTYSAKVQLNREYKIVRSSGINPKGFYKGTAASSQIEWPEGHLVEADYAPLLEMLDWLKSNDDEALMFFPQATRQSEIILGTVESDTIAFNDVYSFQPDSGIGRRLSCTIPLNGVAFK